MNPVLLLHGALGSKTQLEPLKSLLESKGRTVYLMNFSGHSGSPFSNTFGIETFADDVEDYLDQNAISQVDIFGYSMGGYVALWFAYLNPEKVGKIVTLGTKFDWSIESAAHETKKLNAEKIEEKIPAFARILQHRHAPNDWKELLSKTAVMMTGLGAKPLLTPAILSSLKNEIHILLGDQDDMADRSYSEEVSLMLPNASFSLLSQTPHPIEKVNLAPVVDLF
jgi:pimeloyl-ACP methyl ester carboxylesterase